MKPQRIWFLLVACCYAPILSASASAPAVTLLDPNGAFVRTIDLEATAGQLTLFVEFGNDGSIWAATRNAQQLINVVYPNDVLKKFSPTGTLLLTVGGPVQGQVAFTEDSDGNLYVAGGADGGPLNDNGIFKFDAAGSSISSFGLNSSGWRDLAGIAGNRVFAISNDMQSPPGGVVEYSATGAVVNQVGSFDGKLRTGAVLEPSKTNGTFWSLQGFNGGPGDDNYVVNLNANLEVISSFGLKALGYQPYLDLATLPNGNLLLNDPLAKQLYEVTPTGDLARTMDYSALISDFVEDVDVDQSGNIALTYGSLPVPEPTAAMLMGIAFVAIAASSRRRRKSSTT